MIIAAIAIAIAVPSGPAFPRNVFPGMTNAPHPIIHPSASDHTFTGDRLFSSFTFSFCMAKNLSVIIKPALK